ncbi:MAG TPA: hypothetical protein VJ728_15930, partial [Candidatus Binataceae bacterium]|nr:hypothetical protein [Candidatus Binataceae bacterium]
MTRRAPPGPTDSSKDASLRGAQSAQSALNSALSADVATVPGVGPPRRSALQARGIVTLADALMSLPYRYEDLRRRDDIASLRPGDNSVLEGILQNVADRPMPGRWSRRMATALLRQTSGKSIRVVWFNLHSGGLPAGEPLVLVGRVTSTPNGMLQLVHPEIYRLRANTIPAIRAVYSLPPEIPQRMFASIVGRAFERAIESSLDAIPSELRQRAQVCEIIDALRYLHQPPAAADLKELQSSASAAHRALVMNEMFTFQLALAQ